MTRRRPERRPLRASRVVTACGSLVLAWVLGSWLLHVNLGDATGSWAGAAAPGPTGASAREELLPQRLSSAERLRMLELRAHTIVSLRAR
ncbi:MAG: hypothetical protein PHU75_09070 [Candidatus Nanopelagicales bacterium]|nr:hypothetical protein [Candidatus Nanopelagicales bacterium]